MRPFSAYRPPYCGCPPRPSVPGSAPAPPRTPSHEDGWGGGVSLSPLLPFQAPAGTGRLLYLVQRLSRSGGSAGIGVPNTPQSRFTSRSAKSCSCFLSIVILLSVAPVRGFLFWCVRGPLLLGLPLGRFQLFGNRGLVFGLLVSPRRFLRSMLRTRTASCSGVMYSFTT